jgi:hypothetical protein
VAEPSSPPTEAEPADASPRAGFGWRSTLAVVLVVMTVIGAAALTDDSWPFAPFRLFSVAVKPNGRVVKVDFIGTTESGRTVHLDAEDFGLRRAEVEGQQGEGGRLTMTLMGALFRTWNRAHPDDPLTRLQFRMLGRRLVGGRPVSSFSRILETYPAEAQG